MTAKKRWLYSILILITVPLGLATRWAPQYFSETIQTYGGDVLYATLIFFIIRFLWPSKTFLYVLLVSYAFCIAIEVQQLYQAEWIVKLRHTFPFGLILGYSFLWGDCVCYAVGVVLGFITALILERLLFNKK
ncbi:DUF2809 domain-containing protein [Chitinophagaceae bacterium LWZ2-11]